MEPNCEISKQENLKERIEERRGEERRIELRENLEERIEEKREQKRHKCKLFACLTDQFIFFHHKKVEVGNVKSWPEKHTLIVDARDFITCVFMQSITQVIYKAQTSENQTNMKNGSTYLCESALMV